MKISESWLREFSNPDVSTQLLCDQLTLAGLEVDGVESVCGEFSNVVVGEILEILPHPNADKLRLCKVDVKSEIIDIVCGAPNIYVGMKAPVAMIGALLPGGFEIKKSKLRGVPSNGMMCSEKELGISDGQGGLFDLPKELMVGDDIKSALSLDDVSIDIDLTPNRADCLSVIGVAREVSTLNRIDIKMPLIESVPAVNDDMVEIDVQDRLGCPKYCARIIRDINPKAETPLWLKEKIRRSGLRSISPVVDVTNYILLKYGQPLHAFDLNKIDEKIIVRRAVKDEQLTLLDETKIKLNENTLIIADIHKPLAMAGIMGGLDSSINDETKDILVESAFFDPIQIAGKARQYGLHTDSSHRYERGVDPELCERVIEEATKILLEIVGGNPGPVARQVELKNIPIKTKISLRSKRVKSILGFELNDDFIKDTLVNL
ncbi:MAG: phenylalanyl-tRNA synthetase beta chain, partial [Francisellaceae bacterium]